MAKNLSSLFSPRSIAVVGASRSEKKIGYIVLRNLVESKYEGKLWAVNPHAEKILDVACYENYALLPEIPDLAVVALPVEKVIEAVQQVGEKGTKQMVIFSAGFKEMGEDGEKLEEQLHEVAKKYEINVLGPNCLGFVNTSVDLNVTFAQPVKQKGNLRFISQSGAIAASIFDWAEFSGIGFDEFVTLGNKAVVNENDVLEHWLDKGTTDKKQLTTNQIKINKSFVSSQLSDVTQEGLSDLRPIGIYLESLSVGKEFVKLAKMTNETQPIFILKPGKSKSAQKAMQSHTGAIAGEDAVIETAFAESGVIRCGELEDLFDLSKAFSWENPPRGPRVAIVSNAGGPAVISADAIEEEDLQLAEISDQVHQQLQEKLPRSAGLLNPIDVLGDALAQRYADAMEILAREERVDALVVILTPQVMTEIEQTAEAIVRVSQKYRKPILCSFMGGNLVSKGETILNSYKIPCFRFPERAIKALGKMWKWKKRKNSESRSQEPEVKNKILRDSRVESILDMAKKENRATLSIREVNEVLKAHDINVTETRQVDSLESAQESAKIIGLPVVLKIDALGLLHKTEVGGVISNISSEEGLRHAWEEINSRIGNLKNQNEEIKVVIQKHIAGGIEVIMGVKQDGNFGHVMLFGFGGTLAEMVVDQNLALLPIDEKKAGELIEKSKAFELLKGFRGGKVYELSELKKLLVGLSMLAESYPEIAEIEINPVIVTHESVWAVDGKIILT